MLKQPIYVEFNLDAKVNNSKLIAISHVDDKYSETLEVAVKQNDRFVYMGGATVVARMVLHREKDYLLSDSVPCTVNDNGNILIPFDNAVVKTLQGTVKIEVNITRDADELTLQFPLWVSVSGSILDNAEVTPDSKGTIPELLKEAKEVLDDATAALERLGSYDNLADKPQISGVTLSGDKTPDELGLQKKLTAGNNVEINENGVISTTIIFVVNLTLTSNEGGIMDKTVEQIAEAYYQGKTIIFTGVFSGQEVGLKAIAMLVGVEDETITLSAIAITEPDGTLYHVYIPRGETDFFSLRTYNLRGIASASVNQNGTISFYDADGNLLFTTSGANLVTSGNQQISMGYDSGGFYFLFDDGQEAV